MIRYTTTENEQDLHGIIALQQANLADRLSVKEIKEQGFVTVRHGLSDLQKMDAIEKSILAKDDDQVIGYLLAMTERSKDDIPILIPMFELFKKINFNGKPVSEYNYMVVGQVCISKQYRGKGILDDCYKFYKEHFKNKYDLAITEIATTNLRSIRAHERTGFREIHRYTDPGNTEWSVVAWDWKKAL